MASSALRCSRSNDGMQFINHQNNITLGALNFIHNSFETLLKFAPEAGACDHCTKVESDDFFT